MKIKMKNPFSLVYLALYALIMGPVMYAIYYSVPASDDFAMALGRVGSENAIVEIFTNMSFFWNKRGGTFIYFLIEMIINPLNCHEHLGHRYGLYMVIAYVLCLSVIAWSLRKIYDYVLGKSYKYNYVVEAGVFLTIASMLCTYFYVEAHSWYVGMIGYQMPMALILVSFACTILYADTNSQKYYVIMIITGIIAANNFVYDIPIGLFYLYIMYYKKGFKSPDKKSAIKKAIPLVLYVIFGLISVIAPGNYVRQGQYTEKPGIVACLAQTVADVVERVKFVILAHPFTLLLFLGVFIVGILANRKDRNKMVTFGNLVLTAVVLVIAWIGCILPYVYGRGATTTYLDVRIQYVLDTFIELGIALLCLKAGCYLSGIVKKWIAPTAATGVVMLMLLAYTLTGGRTATILQIDLLNERPFITASYELWNGILAEIEASPEDTVVINRDYNVNWNKFFLYSGMESGEEYALDLDCIYDSMQILPNVYYQKKSITINYPQ